MKHKFSGNRLLQGLALGLAATLVACGVEVDLQAQTPVAHWTFDQGLNDYDQMTISDSSNSNDATWVDGTDFSGLGFVAGQIGGAAKLRGGGDEYFTATVAELANIAAVPAVGSPVAGTGFTISTWINADPRTDGFYKGIFASRSATDIRFDASGEATDINQNWGLALEVNANPIHIDARTSGAGVDSPDDSIIPGTWHHVAFVWGITPLDSSNASTEVYIDGTMVASTTPVGTNDAMFEFLTGGTWLLGNDTCCGGREFDGAFDDFAIYDSALTSGQINTIRSNGITGTDASGASTGTIAIADVDASGSTNLADFTLIRNNLGTAVTDRALGDIDGNRRVDLNDYQLWLESVPPLLAQQALASVPEPSTAVLCSIMAASCLVSRRKR